jgi:hypothetical protein
MADKGRDETTQQAPPVDQPTEDSPALTLDDSGPQVVDSTAVEEPAEQQPPVRAAEEQVAPTGGPEPSFEPSGGTTPLDAHRAGAEDPGRPELAVLGAFAGAFVFAQILKRLGGGRDE